MVYPMAVDDYIASDNDEHISKNRICFGRELQSTQNELDMFGDSYIFFFFLIAIARKQKRQGCAGWMWEWTICVYTVALPFGIIFTPLTYSGTLIYMNCKWQSKQKAGRRLVVRRPNTFSLPIHWVQYATFSPHTQSDCIHFLWLATFLYIDLPFSGIFFFVPFLWSTISFHGNSVI